MKRTTAKRIARVEAEARAEAEGWVVGSGWASGVLQSGVSQRQSVAVTPYSRSVHIY